MLSGVDDISSSVSSIVVSVLVVDTYVLSCVDDISSSVSSIIVSVLDVE